MTNGQELVVASRPQAIAVRRDDGMVSSMQDMMQVADIFAKSGLFNDVRDVAKAFVKIQAGRELGIPPFASMRGIAIIQGSPAMGATLVAGRMKAHGYDWTEIRRDNEVCELEIIKPNGKRAGVARFSMDDAKNAGLNGKDNWKKYPKSMLFARCITDAARTFAPEVFSGIPVYTAEELGAERTDEDGSVIEAPHVEPPPPTKAESKTFDMKRMIESIVAMKEKIGKEAYYRILGNEGFEHANDIKDRKTGVMVYKLMEMEAKQQASGFHADDSDVPEVIGDAN